MKKKFKLTSVYHLKRPLSYSAISSFKWNPSQWHSKYVLKEIPEITPELEFGSMIDKRIQDDPQFLPQLIRYPILQHEMRCMFGDIPLLGFADTFVPANSRHISLKGDVFYKNPAIRDYKTGRQPWTQKRADETGQLTMYLLMLWLQHKIRPEDVECYIDWLPTHYVDNKIAFIEPVEIHTFKTKRTMSQVLMFAQDIKDVWAEMEEFAQRQEELEVDTLEDW